MISPPRIKIYSVLLSCFFHGVLGAQVIGGRGVEVTMQSHNMHYSTVDGQPILTTRADQYVEGTPYFSTTWMKATAIFSNGKWSTPFPVRINVLNGQVHYLNEKGKEFIATSPINELLLTDTITGKKYHFVNFRIQSDTKPSETWHQVLVADSVSLYKVFAKELQEVIIYGSSVLQKKLSTTERYMVQQGNKASMVKKPKDLLALYPQQKEKLSAFINSKPERDYASTDAQFTAIVSHLNTLIK